MTKTQDSRHGDLLMILVVYSCRSYAVTYASVPLSALSMTSSRGSRRSIIGQ